MAPRKRVARKSSDGLAPRDRKAALAAKTGARPATKADFAAGLPYYRTGEPIPYRARYYVLDGVLYPRRQAEKAVIGTPEAFADKNRFRRGGVPNASARYYRYLRAYSEAMGRKVSRSDPTFRRLYAESQLSGRDPAISRRRVAALSAIFPDDAIYATYQEAYVR